MVVVDWGIQKWSWSFGFCFEGLTDPLSLRDNWKFMMAFCYRSIAPTRQEISEEINPMQFVYRIYSGVAMLTDLPEEISFVKFNLSLNKQL